MNRRTALMLSMLGGLVPQTLLAQTLEPKVVEDARQDASRRCRARDEPDEPPPRRRAAGAVRARARLPVAPIPDRPVHQARTANQSNPAESHHRLDLQANRVSPSGTAKRSPCSRPREPSCAPTIRPRCSSRSTRSSSDSPTPPKTCCRCMSSSSPRSTPAGDTRSYRGSRSSAAARKASRSGRCGWRTRRSSSLRCKSSKGSASSQTSASRWSTARRSTIKTSEPRTFASGLQREGAPEAGFQARADKIEESIMLKFSPLLNFDGDATRRHDRPDRQHRPVVPSHASDHAP